MKKLIIAAILALSSTQAVAQSGNLPSGYVWGNPDATSKPAKPATMSGMIDRGIGSTRGSVLYRGASGWNILPPGTAGNIFVTGGAGADPSWGSVIALTSLALGGCTIGADTLCVTGSSTFTGNVTGTGNIEGGAASAMGQFGRSIFASPSDGVVTWTNNAGTSFTRMNLGPATASFPAIKRNGAAINFRLADDSADASITAAAGAFSASSTLTLNQNGSTLFSITNTSAGTAAQAALGASNGTATGSFGIGGTGYTAVPLATNRVSVVATVASDGILLNNQGSDPIIFATSDTERARITPTGGLAVGLTTDTTAGVVNVLTGFRIGSAAASGNVLRGNGTNFVSSTLATTDLTGLGTGVATALAINVGTAGSFVVNGGALGSPSSAGTIPAFTLGGTISGGGNQINNIIIGASTPLAGTFTTLIGTGGTLTGITSLGIRDTSAAFDVTIAATSSSALSAGRTLTLNMQNVAHILSFGSTANTGSGIIFPNVTSDTVAMLGVANVFTANQTISSASLTMSGNISSAAWTTNGARFKNTAVTLTDTSSSGTVALGYSNTLGGNTIAASSATTFTRYEEIHFTAPVAGSNVTLTNGYAFGADSAFIGDVSPTATNAGEKMVIYGSVGNHVALRIGNTSASGYSTLWTGAVGNNEGYIRYGASVGNKLQLISSTGGATPVTIATAVTGTDRVVVNDANIDITPTAASTSKTTGSLTNKGGFGNAGAIFTDTLSIITVANSSTTSALCWNTGTGLVTYNGTVGTCTVSTLAAKNLTKSMTPKEGLEIVLAMVPWWYTLREGLPTYQPGEEMGLIAEFARKVEPRMVANNPDGTAAGVRYEQYTAALTAAIKYLKADNDNIRQELNQLRKVAR